MSEKSADRTTRRLTIAVFGFGGGLGFIGGTLFGFWLVSLNGLIRADEAVWQPVEGVTGKRDGNVIPMRMFYTQTRERFIEFGESDQWLLDAEAKKLYRVGDFVSVSKRQGRWIARGVPLWRMSMDDPKIDHDPQLVLKHWIGVDMIRFFDTDGTKVEIRIDDR
jgi:hypothetical protein